MSDSTPRVQKPRFLVSNFMGAINVNMNEAFALDLFDLVRSQKDVLPHLYALTEKIENQFYFMGRLTTRKEGEVPVEAEAA